MPFVTSKGKRNKSVSIDARKYLTSSPFLRKTPSHWAESLNSSTSSRTSTNTL
jgi:hypothetical protein